MNKKIIWSDFAIENLKDIYDYYKTKATRKIAEKIRLQIFETTKQLLSNPESGQVELYLEKINKNYRYILSGNYKIIYRVDKENIIINDVFDVRQNPTKMIDENRNKR